jgi:capsular polysaccharide export protein
VGAPLLRSPPFPGVRAGVAAVSMAGRSAIDATTAFAAIREARVGGTFWARPAAVPDRPIVVACAARETAVSVALAALRGEGRRAPVLLVPDAPWTRRLAPAGVAVVRGDVDPWSLLARDVTVAALGGEEIAAFAVIAGVPVLGAAPDAAAWLAAARYRDPFTGADTGLEAAVATLADWRRLIDANRAIAVAAGMARWKRDEIARFLWAPRARPLRFPRSPARAVAEARAGGGGIAIWPSRVRAELIDEADAAGVPLHRVEDGFIRSVGLGSALHPPQSVAVDGRGIHYDPSRRSDLEHLLETAEMPPALLARADALADAIVTRGIGKYGAGPAHVFPARVPGRRLVLVAGQVEDDMSVLLGGGGVRGNRELLRRARAMEPDAEIWFRPHPDIDAGHRRGAVPDAEALTMADRVVRGGGMAALLDMVDGVHVLTSLTGFEALLRGRDVTCHGAPFFAGWGLTRDAGTVPERRTRRVTLAQLVAATLILYPRYLDPVTGLPCPPEVLVARLGEQVRPRATLLTRARGLQGRLARLARLR